MRVTKRLLGALNRVFNKDPAKFLAFRLSYAGGLTWQVQDAVLTTTVSSGPGNSLSIDLTQYTLAGLTTYLAGQTGYTLYSLAPVQATLSAAVLLDASGDLSQPSGGDFYGYGSLLWAWLETAADQLHQAWQQIQAMPAEMSIPTADGQWLDYLGGYYAVPRNPGEPDSYYGPRIIATVLLPRGNNIAIESAILSVTGQKTTVVDVQNGGGKPQYDGSILFNGANLYDTSSADIYCLFDVDTGFDPLGSDDPTTFIATVEALIETMRDAGCYLRAINLGASAISDQLPAMTPTDTASLGTTTPLYFDGSAQFGGLVGYSGFQTVGEVLIG